jgi:hypothetical protein
MPVEEGGEINRSTAIVCLMALYDRISKNWFCTMIKKVQFCKWNPALASHLKNHTTVKRELKIKYNKLLFYLVR